MLSRRCAQKARIGWFLLILIVTRVAGDEGPFSISPTYPAVCTASTVTYSSSLVQPTGSIDIDPGTYGMGNPGQEWTFAVSPGIVLSDWGMAGSSLTVVNSNHSTYNWTFPKSGDFVILGSFTAEAEYDCGDSVSSVSSTVTSTVSGAPTASYSNATATLLPHVTSSNASCSASSTFTLTITATIPCNKPVVVECDANDAPPLTPESWAAWNMDDWLESYVGNTSHWQEMGVLYTFFDDFTGGLQYDSEYNCSASDESKCTWIGDCSDLKTGPETWLSTHKTQAYLAWAAFESNLMLNLVYNSFQTAMGMLNSMLTGLGSTFITPPNIKTAWYKPFSVLNAIMTALAVIFIMVPGFDITTGILIGAAALFAGISAVGGLTASEQYDTWNFAEISEDGTNELAFIEQAWNSVDQLHDSLFVTGTNLTTVMKGGYFLGNGEVLALSGGTNGSLIQPSGNTTLDVADQLVTLVTEAVINAYFKSSSAFILYIPFGMVLDAEGHAKNNYVEFDETSCRAMFLNVAAWTNQMVGTCDQGGLSVLVNAFNTSAMNPVSGQQPPSWWTKANYDYGLHSFSPQDMIAASVNGFLNYGFNHNVTDDIANTLLNPDGNDNLDMILNLNPSSAGSYNLHVCRLYDLSVVPFITFSTAGQNSQAQWLPCPCMSTQANITIPGTNTVQYFKDYMDPGGAYALSNTPGEGKLSNSYMGYGKDSCLAIYYQ